jgi:NDP-hexose-3-ketoreductase
VTAPGTTERLRMAVLGCADIAWRRALPAMAAEPLVQIAAIASRTQDKADRFTAEFGGVAVEGYAELLQRDDVDAVYIPLPALMHGEWIERALDAGKHVMVEKPMTGSHAETARLVALAHERGLVLLENFMFLYHSQHASVRKLLADGAIGDLRGFSSSFTIPPKPLGDIRYLPDIGGGAFLDFGGYPVRAALHFLGDLEVIGVVFRQDRDHGAIMSGSMLLCDAAGVPARLSFGMEHSYRTSYSLSGSTGRLMLDRVFTPPASYQPVVRVERQDHREEIVLPADHQWANVMGGFARAVLTGGDLRSQDEGTLRQAALMERVLAAARIVRF